MPEFEIMMRCGVYKVVTVQCDSEEEAREHPWEYCTDEQEVDQFDWEILSIEQTEED